jgi:uncharacterized membrane protein YphA (DoxX/SURF4 family)/transposase
VWAFVQSIDLQALYARIRAVEGSVGRAPIDPAILVSLWLYATLDGVGSARELDRLCDSDDACCWLCGAVGVNHHTLGDLRVEHAQWLDAQLTRSVAGLLSQGLVSMNRMAHDGMRVRAHAGAASFRRSETLEQLLQDAQDQVQTLKQEVGDDAGCEPPTKWLAQGPLCRGAKSKACGAKMSSSARPGLSGTTGRPGHCLQGPFMKTVSPSLAQQAVQALRQLVSLGACLDPLQPLTALVARLYVAQVFWLSGLTKLHDWETTMFFSPMNTRCRCCPRWRLPSWARAGSRCCPFCSLLGWGRFAALGLFVVNAVAVVSLSEIAPAALQQHILWGGFARWGGGVWAGQLVVES